MSFILPEGTPVHRSEVPPLWRPWRVGPRLASLAQGVPQGSRVVDIGTDHALLPELLLRSGWVVRAMGIDCAQEALQAAQTRLGTSVGTEGAVELCLGEGLSPVKADNFDCAVLAGFGSRKMIELMERDPPEALGIHRLVCQPTAGLPALRTYLCRHGWKIAHEAIVSEGRRGFITSVVEWDGRARCLDPLDTLVGKIPRDEPLLRAWMHVQHQHLLRQGERMSDLRTEVENWLRRATSDHCDQI